MSGGKARRSVARPQLDQDVIVAAAIDLAGAGEPITFRALGTALGADPTAVYRHFRDKEELMKAVVDRLIVSMNEQVDETASWRDQLRDGAALTIDIFSDHPYVGVEASAIATGGPGELGAINWILTQFGRAGLGKEQAVRFYAAYSSYVLAAAAALLAYVVWPFRGPLFIAAVLAGGVAAPVSGAGACVAAGCGVGVGAATVNTNDPSFGSPSSPETLCQTTG